MQAYTGSNSATGLTPTNASAKEQLLPTPLKEFDYEPRFPIAVMAPPVDMDIFKREIGWVVIEL